MSTAPQTVPTGAPPQGPPPQAVAIQLMTGMWTTQAISAMCQAGIPDLLAQGPRPVEELARASATDPGFLYRIMRSLASVGIFTDEGERRFGLTPVGHTLRSDVPGSMRHFALFVGSPAHWKAWGSLPQALRTGQDAFSLVHRMGFFEYAQTDAAFDQVFNASMTAFSAMEGMAVKAAYDFSGVGRLVDVGGGQGLLLGTILEGYPALKGVLYDLPHVVAQAEPLLRQAGVLDRVERVGGDFFESVPSGGDTYIMKSILHDWPDEACVKILKNCARAMQPGGRVLAVDLVMSTDSRPEDGKFLDLEMLVMTQGGKERTEAEFAALFQAAGLRLNRVVRTMSPRCVIEAVSA